MRKSGLKSFTALSVLAAIWAFVGAGSSLAQPRATNLETSQPPSAREATHFYDELRAHGYNDYPSVPGLYNHPTITTFAEHPPSATSSEPPAARRVRSGWRTDNRAQIRAPNKAIQCGRLLDVRAQRVMRNVTILINGERITEIRHGRVRPSNADAVIDLHDQVCAPGLMDMHLHLAASYLRTGETHRPADPLQYTASEAAIAMDHARETLLAGLTTIRSPGEMLPEGASVYLREAIDKWEILGPRLFMATRMLADEYSGQAVEEAGQNYYETRLPAPIPLEIWEPGQDIRAAVRNSLALGEDWLKLSVDVGGDMNDGEMPYVRINTLEEMRAAADEAHRLGARITGHIETDAAARDAVLAGLDSIEHAYVISRETADLMRAHNVYWSTTLSDMTLAHDPTDPRIGAEPVERNKDLTDWIRRRDAGFRYAYSIGVPIVYASDGWFNPGNDRGRMVLEFSEYLALGVRPWDVLKFATLNPAAMLGQADNLGSVDPGKYADIIAFPNNPLEDVRTYAHVTFVMKGGNVVRDDLHRNPLPDVFALQMPDVAYTVTNPNAPFTVENLTCTGRDC